ncbi:MAG: HipA domain-containing protein [Fluviibacter sp.]
MRLDVWLDQAQVGSLSYDAATNRFAFDYAADWLARKDAVPLSPVLPLRAEAVPVDQHSAMVRRFFENLLPEGQALEDAARANHVAKGNLPGLLIALGRETAGALRLVLSDSPGSDQANKRLLLRDELAERIRQRPYAPFSVWDGKVRLSIAGFQDKLAVYTEEDEECEASDWFLVEGPDLASTHILKPEPINPQLAGLTSNEFFCMKLAASTGLETAEVALHYLPEPVLRITRFDRVRQSGAVRRRHIIDGCQLLDLASSYKYERPYGYNPDVREIRDGASLASFFSAIKASPQPAKAKLQLLRWLIFQVLLGNADAHAKNLSFYMTASGPVQAPAYDLICSALYPTQVSQNFAMAVGDAFATEELSAYEWAQFCVATETNPTQVRKEIERSVGLILKHLPKVAEEAIGAGALAEVVNGIAAIVRAQCDRQLTLAPKIRGMMPGAQEDRSRA